MVGAQRLLAGGLTLALVLGLSGTGLGQGNAPAASRPAGEGVKDMAAVVADEFKTFSELAKTAGLTDTLKEKGPMTLFAPTDEAFAALPKEKLEALRKDPAGLKAALLNHLTTTEIGPKALPTVGKIKTMGTMELTTKAGQDASVIALVNDAKAIKRLRASNGRIYSIDKVLLPTLTPAGK